MLACGAVTLAAGLLASAAAQEPDRPLSVLFLLSDDQRADTIGALGNDRIQTPNLDALVEQGFSFDRAYCMGSSGPAVCSPSRAMLLSGRSLFHLDRNVYEASDKAPILPEHLRADGYATFATGKWHNGSSWFQRGFSDGGALLMGAMGPHRGFPQHEFDERGRYGWSRAKPATRRRLRPRCAAARTSCCWTTWPPRSWPRSAFACES